MLECLRWRPVTTLGTLLQAMKPRGFLMCITGFAHRALADIPYVSLPLRDLIWEI